MSIKTARRSARDSDRHTPRKKRKLADTDDAASDVFAPDQLQWKSVAFPEHFDDAEGFFGLEEISGVEVVRDPGLGKVQYRAANISKKRKRPISNVAGNIEDVLEDHLHSVHAREETNEDEWEGIVEVKTKNEAIAKAAAKSKVVKARPQKGKGHTGETARERNSAKKQKPDPSCIVGNPFENLNDDSGDEGDVSAWADLHLSSEILAALARLRFSKPTPIQERALPDILEGRDVIGKAATGSGKTLAFAIAVYQHYLNIRGSRKASSPVALILSPTRELAKQLSQHMTELCQDDMYITTVTGGLSVHKQKRQLETANVIIGTPGRLWEVINGDKSLIGKLQNAKFLVLDEADRLLSEGHFKEVEEILNVLDRPLEADDVLENYQQTIADGQTAGNEEISIKDSPGASRQTLIFSATFQRDLQQKLAGKSKSSGAEMLNKQESMEYLIQKLNFREATPRFIDVNPVSQMASNLKEGIIECAGLEKDLYLYALLLLNANTRTLVFTNSISSVRRLLPFLQNLNLNVQALHSQMPQKARLRTVERFSSLSSAKSILIATDVAARGLDIPQVDLVLHYHVPRAADMYVHRSGRTARAERTGQSVLLCAPEEVQGVRRLVAKVHARNAIDEATSKAVFLRTIELDRRVVVRIKPRVTLAKKIADTSLAKEKKGHEDNWLRTAAEELGVDYDSDEFAANSGSQKGRGRGRQRKEQEARGLSKAEVGALRAELRGELAKRVNIGVSEKYLTAGGVDIEELLQGDKGEFLGRAQGMVDD